jgi:hypothetical protein
MQSQFIVTQILDIFELLIFFEYNEIKKKIATYLLEEMLIVTDFHLIILIVDLIVLIQRGEKDVVDQVSFSICLEEHSLFSIIPIQ